MGSVITLSIADYQRNIQIIFTHKTKYQILDDYDQDYTKCLYDGEKLLGTLDFIESLVTQTITNAKPIHINRILKGYRKGYSYRIDFNWTEEEYQQLSSPEVMDKMEQTNFAINNRNKYYYPRLEEFQDLDRLKFMIRKCLNSKWVTPSFAELLVNFNYQPFSKTDPYFADHDSKLKNQIDNVGLCSDSRGGNFFKFIQSISLKTPILPSPYKVRTVESCGEYGQEKYIILVVSKDNGFANILAEIENKFHESVENNPTLMKRIKPSNRMSIKDYYENCYRPLFDGDKEFKIKFKIHPFMDKIYTHQGKKIKVDEIPEDVQFQIEFEIDGIWKVSGMFGLRKCVKKITIYPTEYVRNGKYMSSGMIEPKGYNPFHQGTISIPSEIVENQTLSYHVMGYTMVTESDDGAIDVI